VGSHSLGFGFHGELANVDVDNQFQVLSRRLLEVRQAAKQKSSKLIRDRRVAVEHKDSRLTSTAVIT
jgi:hypothetical protein